MIIKNLIFGTNFNMCQICDGTYSTASTIKLKGLPSRQAILFRVCSMGAYQRKSAWTEAVKGVCGVGFLNTKRDII